MHKLTKSGSVYFTDDSYYSSYPFPSEWIELFRSATKNCPNAVPDSEELLERFTVGVNIKYEPVISPREVFNPKVTKIKSCTSAFTRLGAPQSPFSTNTTMKITTKAETAKTIKLRRHPQKIVLQPKTTEQMRKELIHELQKTMSRTASAKRKRARRRILWGTEGKLEQKAHSTRSKDWTQYSTGVTGGDEKFSTMAAAAFDYGTTYQTAGQKRFSETLKRAVLL